MATTKYNINDIVYAIDTYHYTDDEPKPYTQDFHRICRCMIRSIYISEDNDIEYYLKDLKDNNEWDTSTPEKEIFKTIGECTKYLIKLCGI